MAGTALCEPPCADFVAGTALCEPPCADFVAGAALCEPPCADFVAGAALCEPPCAEFVAGAALCEPPGADFMAGAIQNAFREIADARNAVVFNRRGGSEAGKSSFAERRVRDGLGSCSGHEWSDHARITVGSWSESSLHCGWSFHLFLEVQNSWQAQHFVNLHVQISWQAQH